MLSFSDFIQTSLQNEIRAKKAAQTAAKNTTPDAVVVATEAAAQEIGSKGVGTFASSISQSLFDATKKAVKTELVKLDATAVAVNKSKAAVLKFKIAQSSDPSEQARWVLEHKVALIAEMAGEANGLILSPDYESAVLPTDTEEIKVRKLIQSCVVKSVQAAQAFLGRRNASAYINAAIEILRRLLGSGYSLHKDTREGGERLMEIMNDLRIAVSKKVPVQVPQNLVDQLSLPVKSVPLAQDKFNKLGISPSLQPPPKTGNIPGLQVAPPPSTQKVPLTPIQIGAPTQPAVKLLAQWTAAAENTARPFTLSGQSSWIMNNKTGIFNEMQAANREYAVYMREAKRTLDNPVSQGLLAGPINFTVDVAKTYLESKNPKAVIEQASRAVTLWDKVLLPQMQMPKDVRNFGSLLTVFCRRVWAAAEDAQKAHEKDVVNAASLAAALKAKDQLAKSKIQQTLVAEAARKLALQQEAARQAEVARQKALADLAAAKTLAQQQDAQRAVEQAMQIAAQQVALRQQAEAQAAQQKAVADEQAKQAALLQEQAKQIELQAQTLAAQQEAFKATLVAQAEADAKAAQAAADAAAQKLAAEQAAANAAAQAAAAQSAAEQAAAQEAARIAAEQAQEAAKQQALAEQANAEAAAQAQATAEAAKQAEKQAEVVTTQADNMVEPPKPGDAGPQGPKTVINQETIKEKKIPTMALVAGGVVAAALLIAIIRK